MSKNVFLPRTATRRPSPIQGGKRNMLPAVAGSGKAIRLTMPTPIVIPEKGLPFVRLVKHIDISRYGSEIMKSADIDIPRIGPAILIWSRRDLWVFAP
jgi:hypothetical protein